MDKMEERWRRAGENCYFNFYYSFHDVRDFSHDLLVASVTEKYGVTPFDYIRHAPNTSKRTRVVLNSIVRIIERLNIVSKNI